MEIKDECLETRKARFHKVFLWEIFLTRLNLEILYRRKSSRPVRFLGIRVLDRNAKRVLDKATARWSLSAVVVANLPC